ncbi:MAG: FHA domain-containing protein [Desulfococcaceae bacterium]|jgi:pSer/pThr/pTyr-binding forkhead associated (FHA) protein|nr:FHA domain-containing protein [Desulfococcaceae bacterium]
MIVFCEDCGERNIVDLEAAVKSGKPVRCQSCHDILRLNIPAEKTAEIKSAAPLKKEKPAAMELRFGETIVEVSQTRPSVTMGRQEHNDLEVIDTRVSRSHARIEYRNGSFVLTDHSTNGTFVMTDKGQGKNLKREEMTLEENGFITLGRKVSPDSPKTIRFLFKNP